MSDYDLNELIDLISEHKSKTPGVFEHESKTPGVLRAQRIEEANRQHGDIYEFRKKEYTKIFWAICIYIFLILLILATNSCCLKLENSVLIALLTTTTANVLGILLIASKWLFPVKNNHKLGD